MVILVLAWILIPEEKLPLASKPAQIIARDKATMEEKRENRRIIYQYSKALGYTQREGKCLITLWTRESRFDHLADNPRSSAYGIAQLLREKSSEPEIQVLHGIRYINKRYDNACRALAFHNRRGWY
jgi:hypothetical protein